eukprot:COSAG06_NODE_4109_length_4565_cov_30.220107_1_plen_99_part_00
MQVCRPKATARGVLMGRSAAAAIAGATPVSARVTHQPKNGPRAQLAALWGATESQIGARESENQGQVARADSGVQSKARGNGYHAVCPGVALRAEPLR